MEKKNKETSRRIYICRREHALNNFRKVERQNNSYGLKNGLSTVGGGIEIDGENIQNCTKKKKKGRKKKPGSENSPQRS